MSRAGAKRNTPKPRSTKTAAKGARSAKKSSTRTKGSANHGDAPAPDEPAPDVTTPPVAAVPGNLFDFQLFGAADLRAMEGESEPRKRGRGRPKRLPSEAAIGFVARLAALGLSFEELSYALGVHRNTFLKYRESHFDEAIKRGRAQGRVTSGAVLMREMLAGNIAALIWYEKTRLGMTEKVHALVSNPDGGPLEANVHHSGAIGLYLPRNGRDVSPDEAGEAPARKPLKR